MMASVVAVSGQTRPALQEGNLIGANDVDDERLRHQGLDEPAGLEQRTRGTGPSSGRPRA